MDRRTFITATGAATLAGAASAGVAAKETGADKSRGVDAPSLRSGTRELQVLMSDPEGVSGSADVARQLLMEISRATEDRFKFVLKGGDIGSVDALSHSEADIHFGAEFLNTKHHDGVSFFAGLPWSTGLTPTEFETWLANTSGQELWDELMAPRDIKPLLAGHLGTEPGLWSRDRIDDVNAFSGKRIVVGGLGAKVVRAAGAIPVELQANDGASLLKDSRADAIEVGGLQIAMSANLHKDAKVLTSPGLTPHGHNLTLAIRRGCWESMSPTDQMIFSSCAANAFRNSLAESKMQRTAMMRALKDHHGITIRNFSGDLRRTLDRVSDAVVAAIPGTDPLVGRIKTSYMTFKNVTTS